MFVSIYLCLFQFLLASLPVRRETLLFKVLRIGDSEYSGIKRPLDHHFPTSQVREESWKTGVWRKPRVKEILSEYMLLTWSQLCQGPESQTHGKRTVLTLLPVPVKDGEAFLWSVCDRCWCL